jgi:hypothetical protein
LIIFFLGILEGAIAPIPRDARMITPSYRVFYHVERNRLHV